MARLKYLGNLRPDKAELDMLKETTPTLEEVALTAVISTESHSTAFEQAVFVAPYSCHVEQVALSFAADVPADATDYWTVELIKYRPNVARSIAAKTTEPPDGDEGGEGIGAYSEWSYDLVTIADTGMKKGNVLAVKFTPTGAPDPLVAPAVTFRARPGDVEFDDVVVADTFTRADNPTSMGVTEKGEKTWIAAKGTWGIADGEPVSSEAANTHALVDAGVSDCVVQAKITSTEPNDGLAFRMDSEGYGYRTINGRLYKIDSNGRNETVGGDTHAILSEKIEPGDTVRIELRGSTITAYRQRGSVGGFIQVWTGADPFNADATMYGFWAVNGSSGGYDDFEVTL